MIGPSIVFQVLTMLQLVDALEMMFMEKIVLDMEISVKI